MTTSILENVRLAKQGVTNPPAYFTPELIASCGAALDSTTRTVTKQVSDMEDYFGRLVARALADTVFELPLPADELKERCSKWTSELALSLPLLESFRDRYGAVIEEMDLAALRDRFGRLVGVVTKLEAIISTPATAATTKAFTRLPMKPLDLADLPELDTMLSRVAEGYTPADVAAWQKAKADYVEAMNRRFDGAEMLITSFAQGIAEDGAESFEHLTPHVVQTATQFRAAVGEITPLFALAEFRPLGRRLAKLHDVLLSLESILKLDRDGLVQRMSDDVTDLIGRLGKLEAFAAKTAG